MAKSVVPLRTLYKAAKHRGRYDRSGKLLILETLDALLGDIQIPLSAIGQWQIGAIG
jgi:hypothetical protein